MSYHLSYHHGPKERSLKQAQLLFLRSKTRVIFSAHNCFNVGHLIPVKSHSMKWRKMDWDFFPPSKTICLVFREKTEIDEVLESLKKRGSDLAPRLFVEEHFNEPGSGFIRIVLFKLFFSNILLLFLRSPTDGVARILSTNFLPPYAKVYERKRCLVTLGIRTHARIAPDWGLGRTLYRLSYSEPEKSPEPKINRERMAHLPNWLNDWQM